MKPVLLLRRFWEILRILRRYGMDELLDPLPYQRWAKRLFGLLPGPTPAIAQMSRGERLREALQALGPIFVKFGQLLSMRSDFLPEDYIRELQRLQDQVAPFSGEQAREIVQKSLKQPMDSVFSHFDTVAVASASVAQVHEAQLVGGQKVVVKVLRPNVENEVRRDINLMYMLAGIVTRFWPEAKLFRAKELVRSGERALNDSLDLVIEAANGSRFRANFEDDETIYVPKIYWDYTSTRVLVMERIEGIRFSDIEALRDNGVDLRQLAETIVELFCKQVFRDGYFHGDFHPGNIFIGAQGQYRVVDFGIMGTITDADRELLAEILTGLTRRDYRAVAQAALSSGWAPEYASPEALEVRIRAVSEPIFDKSIEEIPVGWVLGRLFRIMNEFEIRIQPQLLVLQHTIGSIEGEVRAICPDLKLSQNLRPHVERWASERYSVQGVRQRMRKELPYWYAHAHEMPRVIHELAVNLHKRQSGRRFSGDQELSFGKIEMLYRRIFFGVAGLIAGTLGIAFWGLGGFDFGVFSCLVIAAGCLVAAYPRVAASH